MAGLIDTRPGEIVEAAGDPDAIPEIQRVRDWSEIRVKRVDAAPVALMTFWNGKHQDNGKGSVRPDIFRDRVTIGTPGVTLNKRVGPDDPLRINVEEYLIIQQGKGWMRVDGLVTDDAGTVLGNISDEEYASFDGMVDYGDRFKNPVALANLAEMGATLWPTFKGDESIGLQMLREVAKGEVRAKDLDKALARARGGRVEWARVMIEASKLLASRRPGPLPVTSSAKPGAIFERDLPRIERVVEEREEEIAGLNAALYPPPPPPPAPVVVTGPKKGAK